MQEYRTAVHDERAFYLIDGSVEIDGQRFEQSALYVLQPGVAVHLRAVTPVTLALLGGEPMDGPRHIWWNFVSSSEERIEQARADGIPDAWMAAARNSPVYKMAVEWKVALPLHPEYRTLPMVWYVPPLSPITSAANAGQLGINGEIPDVNQLRIPVKYLANLLTAGDTTPVVRALERMLAMRAYQRVKHVEGRPNLRALPEFEFHRSNPDGGLILSGPTVSRLTGEPIIRMTRRIRTPDGSFAGIVSGSIKLAHFQALFERLHFDDGIALNVFHRDGTLLIRAPARPQALGLSISASTGYKMYRATPRGEFQGRSFLDGVERVYSFADLGDLPLIVTVATDVDSIRGVWIYKAAIVGVLILCLCGLSFGLTVLLHREVGRHVAAEASTREANAALAVLARTDGLTGLPNRRSYDEHFAVEWKRAVQLRTPLALMIVDADHFKQFNDRFGHQRGDEVLRAVADCLQRTLDTAGLSFRIGGEEFVALLPGLDATAASVAAERIRRAVVNLRIPHAPEVGGSATVSIGVASADPGGGDPPESLFPAADAALYAAKKAGRNRVRAAAPADPVTLALRA